jgi:hypothetical protein
MLLLGGVIGPPLFVLVFLVEGATRPGYSAWRDFVSALSLGDQGWEQIANFLVCGLLTLGFAIGLRRALRSGSGATWGPLLMGMFGFGLLFASIPPLPTAILAGPSGVKLQTIHELASLVVFTALPAACFVLARRFATESGWSDWATFSTMTGIAVVALFAATITTSALNEQGIVLTAPTGLLQRIAIIVGWGWMSLLATRLFVRERHSHRNTRG